MLEVMSNNHGLLYYIGLALMVFGSFLGMAGNSRRTIGDDDKYKSTAVKSLVYFVVIIGGLIAYYSSILVDYKNTILLMIFLFMLIFAVMEVRLIFSRDFDDVVKVLLTLMHILTFIGCAFIIAATLGRDIERANKKRAQNDSAQVQIQDYGIRRGFIY